MSTLNYAFCDFRHNWPTNKDEGMGAQQSTSVPVAPPANVPASDKATGGISACPVAHEKKSPAPTTQAAECPVQHSPKKYQNPTAYNV